MPLLTHVTRVSSPCPPAAWSAMLASQMAWYSGVSGGFWASPGRLVSSHEFTVPGARFHWPDQSGYLVSSKAAALEIATSIAAVPATATTALRSKVMSFPRSSIMKQRLHRSEGDAKGTVGVTQARIAWIVCRRIDPADGRLSARSHARSHG